MAFLFVWIAPARAELAPSPVMNTGQAPVEEETPPASLSLPDCIAIALKNQSDVLLGQKALEGAKAGETKAKSDYYPQVAVSASKLLVKSGSVGLGQSGTLMTVSQNFYDGGLREALVGGARAGVKQNVFSLERTEQTVAFNVTQNYFALLRAQQLAGVQDSRLKYLGEQLEMVKTRVQVGDAAEVDFLPVEAQLANARVDQLSAKNAVRIAAVQLQSTMGLSPQPEFSIQEVGKPTMTDLHPLEDYIKVAYISRPDVLASEAGVEAARSSVQSAKIVLGPQPFVAGTFDQQLDDGTSHSVAITGGIALDLFNGGRNRAAYEAARANLSSAEVRATQLGKDIGAAVQEAYLNLTSAKERLDASALSLKAAQKNLEAQEGRYKQGLAIPLDLLNAQLEVVTAQSNDVQARYDYYTSVAQLEYALGKQGGLN
jgi:outer membrane protein TolC